MREAIAEESNLRKWNSNFDTVDGKGQLGVRIDDAEVKQKIQILQIEKSNCLPE